MNCLITLALALSMSASVVAQLAGPAPPYREALRNGFLVAAESVLDGVHVVNFEDAPAAIDGRMSNLKASLANVDAMAENEREHIVASKLHAVVFALEACKIVAADGQDTAACRTRQNRAESYVLEDMGVHWEHGVWASGAPREQHLRP